MNELRLEKAVRSDADILFKWANDRETRKNAFTTQPIPYETHIKWFEGKLNSENCIIYICKRGNENIGQLRLEKENETVVVSDSIDAVYRGKGYGVKLLELGFKQALKEDCFSDASCMVANVKYENIASQKCCEKNGFIRQEREDFIVYSKVLIHEQ